MNYAIEEIWPDQRMFESNFLPDKVGHSCDIVYNTFKRLSKSHSATERAVMFQGTAERGCPGWWIREKAKGGPEHVGAAFPSPDETGADEAHLRLSRSQTSR